MIFWIQKLIKILVFVTFFAKGHVFVSLHCQISNRISNLQQRSRFNSTGSYIKWLYSVDWIQRFQFYLFDDTEWSILLCPGLCFLSSFLWCRSLSLSILLAIKIVQIFFSFDNFTQNSSKHNNKNNKHTLGSVPLGTNICIVCSCLKFKEFRLVMAFWISNFVTALLSSVSLPNSNCPDQTFATAIYKANAYQSDYQTIERTIAPKEWKGQIQRE